MRKEVVELTVDDLKEHPVWEFVLDDDDVDASDTEVRPACPLPVDNLAGRMIGLRVMLANGKKVWALLGNIDLENEKSNEHFLSLSVEREGRWFLLARYHDSDYLRQGPSQLVDFLEASSIDDVFPIHYSIGIDAGVSVQLEGDVTAVPQEKLSDTELIELALG